MMDVNNPIVITEEELVAETGISIFDTKVSNPLFNLFKTLLILPDGKIIAGEENLLIGGSIGIMMKKDEDIRKAVEGGIYVDDILEMCKLIVLRENGIVAHHEQYTKEQNGSLLLLKEEGIISYPVFSVDDPEEERILTVILKTLHENGKSDYKLVEPGKGKVTIVDEYGNVMGDPITDFRSPTLWSVEPTDAKDKYPGYLIELEKKDRNTHWQDYTYKIVYFAYNILKVSYFKSLPEAHKAFNSTDNDGHGYPLYVLDSTSKVIRNNEEDTFGGIKFRPKHWRFNSLYELAEFHGITK